MQLRDLIEAVKEHKLTKDALENYRDELSALFSKMSLEMADVLKSKALFIDSYQADTDVAKKRKWQVTEKGLREIELKQYLLATKELLSSLKSRIYDRIYD